MVVICAVNPQQNQNRGLPLRKTGDCPESSRSEKSERETGRTRSWSFVGSPGWMYIIWKYVAKFRMFLSMIAPSVALSCLWLLCLAGVKTPISSALIRFNANDNYVDAMMNCIHARETNMIPAMLLHALASTISSPGSALMLVQQTSLMWLLIWIINIQLRMW